MKLQTYTKKVMKRFMNPKNSGIIKNASAVGNNLNDKCGDKMVVYLKIEKNKQNKDIIKDIKFQTLGCPAAISASDVMCDIVKGKTLEEAEKIKDSNITKKLGGLPMIKVHCSVLGARTLKQAIENYRRKNGKFNKNFN